MKPHRDRVLLSKPVADEVLRALGIEPETCGSVQLAALRDESDAMLFDVIWSERRKDGRDAQA